jgi:carbonic anhydrase
VGVGFLGVEAVATVVLEEEGREAEVVADVAGGSDGFVGEDGHEGFRTGGADCFEGFDDAGVDVGVVEFVDAVVVEEEGEGFGDVFFVVSVAFRVAKGTADEQGGSVADVAGDDGFGELGFSEVGEGRVNGVAEVDARVDEGAVEIEDEKSWGGRGGHRLRVIDAIGICFLAQEKAMCKVLAGEWSRRQFVAGLSAAGVAGGLGWSGSSAFAQSGMTPDAAMRELMAGNERYAAGKITSFAEDLEILKAKTANKQEPFAAVLSCADSRVPVEILFDQSINHIFVCRVAGNVVTPEIMASLEYGVAVLGTKAILVLGHTNCGAISAAVQAKEVPGQISALYQHLMPGTRDANGDVAKAVSLNAAFQARLLRESSTVIAKAVKEGRVKVGAGVYDLGTGRVASVG